MNKIKSLIPESLMGKILMIASLVAIVGALFFDGIYNLVYLFGRMDIGYMFEALWHGEILELMMMSTQNNNVFFVSLYNLALPVLGLFFLISKKPVGKRSILAAAAALVGLLYSWQMAFGGVLVNFWRSLAYPYYSASIFGTGVSLFFRIMLILTAVFICTLAAAVAIFGCFKNARGKIYTIGMAAIGVGALCCAGIIFLWDVVNMFYGVSLSFMNVWSIFCDIVSIVSILVAFAAFVLKRKADDPSAPLLGE